MGNIITPRLNATVINKYIQTITEPIFQEAKLLGVLKAYGRIRKHVAPDIRWRARIKRREPVPIGSYPVNVPFEAPVRHVEAVLPWRAYGLGEYITRQERLVGQDKESNLPRILESIVNWMMDDFKVYLQRVMYSDGDAGTDHIHGLESMFAVDGLVSGTGSAVGKPADVYAGLSTALGAHGGTCSADAPWPEAEHISTEYCAWSPMVVDYSNAKFTPEGITSVSWQTNWRSATRYARTWLLALQGVTPNVMIMHPELERQARESADQYWQMEATKSPQLVDLGITALHFEGVELIADPYCPADTAYLIPTKNIELLMLQNQLIEVHENTDPYANDTFYMDFHGNLRMETPAFFAKLTTISGQQ
jgi:hypothetical protein